MTRGDWAGGGEGSVCGGKSEVCHFAIVSKLSRHQQVKKKESTTRRQAANKWQRQQKRQQGKNAASQRTAAEAETHLYCDQPAVPATINR
jgi:hypothetical protein